LQDERRERGFVAVSSVVVGRRRKRRRRKGFVAVYWGRGEAKRRSESDGCEMVSFDGESRMLLLGEGPTMEYSMNVRLRIASTTAGTAAPTNDDVALGSLTHYGVYAAASSQVVRN
jgi:hypothetical protein